MSATARSSIPDPRSSSCSSFLRGSVLSPLSERRTERLVQLITEQNPVVSERELSGKSQVLGEPFEAESGDASCQQQQKGENRISPGVEPLADLVKKVDRITFKQKAHPAGHFQAFGTP